MVNLEIGREIEFHHSGKIGRGRIVGREPSEFLRGWPTTGTALTVDVGGEWVQVHSSAVQNAAGASVGDVGRPHMGS